MSGINIRYLKQNDMLKLCDFERECHLTEPEIWFNKFNEEEFKIKLEKVKINELENNKIIVAEHEEIIVGRCDAAIILSLFDCEKTGYVDWIYVLKNRRGMGIGKMLLSGVESYFKKAGVNKYYLFTAENEQAQKFYHNQKELVFSRKEVAEKELS